MAMPSELFRMALLQDGVLARADLRAAAVTKSQQARLLREGSLVRRGHRTYVITDAPASERQDLRASCVEADGLAVHRSALRLADVGRTRRPPLPQVLVLRRSHDHDVPGAKVHTTTYLPAVDRTTIDGIPCTTVARTLFGVAGLVGIDPSMTKGTVRDLVDEAIRDRKTTDAGLWSRLEDLRCRGRNGVSVLEEILTRRAGGEVTESWLERQFLEVIRAAGLPEPACQQRIRNQGAFVARVDFLYEAERLVIEVTGRVAHGSEAQRSNDARRRNRLQLAGFVVIEFTYDQIVGSPDIVVEMVRAALAHR